MPAPQLKPDYRDMLSAFCGEKVEFLLVGAHAMAVHGVARYTADIDLWIRPSPENAERVWKALEVFGAPRSLCSKEVFSLPDQVVQFGVAPTRIDIITGIEGVTFDAAWPKRAEVSIENLTIPVIGLQDLIHNKESTGRKKDLLDSEMLKELDQ